MSTIFDLTGKVVLVTGSTGHIGLAVVEMFLNEGARVICGSSSSEKVTAAMAKLAKAYPVDSFLVCQLDVTDDKSISAALAQGVEKFGTINALVNCAGRLEKHASLETPRESFRSIMEVNLFGAVLVSQQVARQMIQQGKGGVIVNICSISSLEALSGVDAYACSKAALLAYTRQLAVDPELMQNSIRTIAVAPGFVPTDLNQKLLSQGDRGARILLRTPMGRYGKPEEIAGVVAFCCSDAASFINGICITVDGGFSICGVSEAMSGKLAITGIPNVGDDITALIPEGTVDAASVPPGPGAPKLSEIIPE